VARIVTRYGLNGPGIESPWGRDFPQPSRPALGPTKTPVQWVPGHSLGVKRQGSGVNLPPPSNAEVKERVELYLDSPSGPSCPVLGSNLPLLFTWGIEWSLLILWRLNWIYTIDKDLVRTSQRTVYASVRKTNRRMPCRENSCYCKNHTELTNALCGQDAGFLVLNLAVHIVTTRLYTVNWCPR
jgi:hypothetical protein